MKTYTGSSSRRWAWFRRMVLRRADGIAYLDRLRIVQTPWFGLYLHRMDAPDPGVDLHDHPWPFVSLVLRGGYHEYRAYTRDAPLFADLATAHPKGCAPGATNHRRRWSIRRMRLDECHSIYRLDRPPTWTLMLVGRRVRDWGFYVPSSAWRGGFVREDYYDSLHRRELTYQEG